jgi:hypothetical protein
MSTATRVRRATRPVRRPRPTPKKDPSVRLRLECLEDRTTPTPVNISQTPFGQGPGGQKSEGTIAIDPTNASRLFAASNKADGTGLFAAYSADGGSTWTPTDLSGLPVGCCDAQATFDSYGNLYMTYLTDSAPHFTVVAVSYSDGQWFDQYELFGSDAGTDQPSIAAGPGGATISLVQAAVSYHDNATNDIVVAAAPVYGFGLVDSFGARWQVPGSDGASFGDIAIGPEGAGIQGHIMVTYEKPVNNAGPAQIFVNLAPPLLLPFGFGPAVFVTDTNVGGFYPIPAAVDPNRGIDAEANLSWDRSGFVNPGDDGRVYLIYLDSPAVGSPDTDVYVRYSDDSGITWSNRVRVNDDSAGATQFMPDIAVDQVTGEVAAAWYDTRNDLTNTTAEVYASVSLSGVLWQPNQALSAGPSDALITANPNSFGDYNTMDAYGGVFYYIWADNSGLITPAPLNLPYFDMATVRAQFSSFFPPPPPPPPPGGGFAPQSQPGTSDGFVVAPSTASTTATDGSVAMPPLSLLPDAGPRLATMDNNLFEGNAAQPQWAVPADPVGNARPGGQTAWVRQPFNPDNDTSPWSAVRPAPEYQAPSAAALWWEEPIPVDASLFTDEMLVNA